MKRFEMYKNYQEDIKIANNAIEYSLIVPNGELICDLYALPSLPTHDYTVYYAKVYEDGGRYHMVYRGLMEDVEPFPYDLDRERIVKEVRYTMELEPYPDDYPDYRCKENTYENWLQ